MRRIDADAAIANENRRCRRRALCARISRRVRQDDLRIGFDRPRGKNGVAEVALRAVVSNGRIVDVSHPHRFGDPASAVVIHFLKQYDVGSSQCGVGSQDRDGRVDLSRERNVERRDDERVGIAALIIDRWPADEPRPAHVDVIPRATRAECDESSQKESRAHRRNIDDGHVTFLCLSILERIVARAKGEFDVKLSPLATHAPDSADGPPLGRMSIDKRFRGDLDATSVGEMLTAGSAAKGSAAYVAVERVTGTLHGKTGSFALHHRGVMTRGEGELMVTVAPDSATGELVGLTGEMAIIIGGGKHSYEFEYTLPE